MPPEPIVQIRPAAFRAAKSATGLSIREIAEQAGLRPATVGHLSTWAHNRAAETSTGRNGRTGLNNAEAIAEALGHPVADLFTHTNGDKLSCR